MSARGQTLSRLATLAAIAVSACAYPASTAASSPPPPQPPPGSETVVAHSPAAPAIADLAPQSCERYVSPNGSDGDPGNADNPWATLAHAAAAVPDNGCVVWFEPGVYAGYQQVERRFSTPTTFRAISRYRTVLENDGTVLDVDGAKNVTFRGFEFRHSGASADGYVVIVDRSDDIWSEDVTFRDNVFHDSFDNDLLKIHNGVRRALVDGNIFYNQGTSEQHMDVNSVTDVTIQDNIFFNDFAASGREVSTETKHYIVVKDSNEDEDGQLGSERIAIRRNVFLNWQGGSENFVKIGNDGKAYHEAKDVTVHNNLMVGNSSRAMDVAFGVSGARDVAFVNNTVIGDLPSDTYGFRADIKGDNPQNQRIEFVNNIWADPTGTMGEEFSVGDPDDTTELVLDNNLYWNAGSAIPPGEAADPLTDDSDRLVANPRLPTDHQGVVLPVWDGTEFVNGAATIRDEFVRLVTTYAHLAENSPAVGSADPTRAPDNDILGNTRSNPDLGAYEFGATDGLPPGGTFIDDNGNVHEGYIEAIAARGITRGCNPPANDRYCPSEPVTRGQMAAFLVRALELPASDIDRFLDDDGSLFEDDINRLAAAGITRGCNPPEADQFCPLESVTRGQMAAFLVRAYGYPRTDVDSFTDDDTSIFEDNINRLAAAGITQGCTDDLFCPTDNVRRDQMASFLGRAEELRPILALSPFDGEGWRLQ